MVVVSDESGSIDDKTLQEFGGHFNAILEQCQPEKVILLHVDTEVCKDEEFTTEDFPVQFKQFGGGGTDMTAAYSWLDSHDIVPDVLVFLSDLYTPFGEGPAYPVFWASTTDRVAPYGTTVRVS